MTDGKKPKMEQAPELRIDLAPPELAETLYAEAHHNLFALSEAMAAHHRLGNMPILSVFLTIIISSWAGVDEKMGLQYVELMVRFQREKDPQRAARIEAQAQAIYAELGKIALTQQLARAEGQSGKTS